MILLRIFKINVLKVFQRVLGCECWLRYRRERAVGNLEASKFPTLSSYEWNLKWYRPACMPKKVPRVWLGFSGAFDRRAGAESAGLTRSGASAFSPLGSTTSAATFSFSFFLTRRGLKGIRKDEYSRACLCCLFARRG